MTNDEYTKMLAQYATTLGEHFDSVFILATKSTPEQTMRFHGNYGNQFATCKCLELAIDELNEALSGDTDEEEDDTEDDDE